MNSSHKRRGEILGAITAKRAEALVTEWVNLREDNGQTLEKICGTDQRTSQRIADRYGSIDAQSAQRIAQRFPEIFGALLDNAIPDEELKVGAGCEAKHWQLVLFLIKGRSYLAKTWLAGDQRNREWYLFRLREHYHSLFPVAKQRGVDLEAYLPPIAEANKYDRLVALYILHETLADVPPRVTPLEAALFHLQQMGDRLRRCPNWECPAPHFIAKKRQQKFCSDACAIPAQREAKRKWWNENRGKGSNSL